MNILQSSYLKIKHSICKQDHLELKGAQLLCAAYSVIVALTLIMNPETKTIIDVNSPENTKNGYVYSNGSYRPVVASNAWEMWCLSFARISAFSMYPVLVAVFLSKCKATLNVIHKSQIALNFPRLSTESHHLHTYAGSYISYSTIIHILFHFLRWANQGTMMLLFESSAGISGLIATLPLPLIACFMLFNRLKVKVSYEIRKKLHYLFYIFAIALCFHVPMSAIPGGGFIAPVMGFTLCYYFLDAAYIALFMTEKIQTPVFQVLKSGFQITMTVSPGFKRRLDQEGGFVYVCFPWINNEWHAFSVFEFPHDDNKRQIFIQNLGDWTNKVHEALKRDTSRPIWVQGPFTGSFHHAENYDNQILVATGIGITPILSAVLAYNKTRRVNIIWVVREEDMLSFFLEYLNINKGGWMLVFYTGKSPLHPIIKEYWEGSNIRIIIGRPCLDDVIPNIICGLERNKRLPVPHFDSQEIVVHKVITKLSSMHNRHASEEEIRKQAYEELRSSGLQLTGLLENQGQAVVDVDITALSTSKESNNIDISSSSEDENHANGTDEESLDKESRRDSIHTFLKDESHSNGTDVESLDKESRRDSMDTFLKDESHTNGTNKESLDKESRRGSMYTFLKSDVTNASSESNIVKELHNVNKRMVRRRNSFATSVHGSIYEPWKPDIYAIDYVTELDVKVLETWGILFCGGNKFVLKDAMV